LILLTNPIVTRSSVVIPAKAGIHCADIEWADEWIPAFAGMTTG
jgi:hypothetical protein